MPSVCLITGESGTGKTSLAATAAEYVFERYSKVTRYYVTDGGGWGSKMDGLIRAGIVEAFSLRTRVDTATEGLIEETCGRAAQGWWPEAFSDPATGAVRPGVKLIPPSATLFRMLCAAGHEVRQATNQKALTPILCSKCGTMVTLATAQIKTEAQAALGYEKVGAMIFDGITSSSGWMLESMGNRAATMELKTGMRIESGEMAFAANDKPHYGMAQTHAWKWLHQMVAIPGLVIPPIVTGLEARRESWGGTALPFYGPALAGSARTGDVPQWVGNWVGTRVITHAEDPALPEGVRQFRLYLTEYRDSDGTPHRYKIRAEPGMMPDFLADAPKAEPFSGFSLGAFFSGLEEAAAKSEAKVRAKFGDKVPGLRAASEAPPAILPGTPAQTAAIAAALQPVARPTLQPGGPIAPSRPPLISPTDKK